jgi:hypothetical protein
MSVIQEPDRSARQQSLIQVARLRPDSSGYQARWLGQE